MNLMRAPKGEVAERVMDKGKPLTPLADRRYEGRIAPVSLQTTPGLCPIGIKCFKPAGHKGDHYPPD